MWPPPASAALLEEQLANLAAYRNPGAPSERPDEPAALSPADIIEQVHKLAAWGFLWLTGN